MMRLSVCLRCGTVFRFKQIDEVIGVFVARFQSNFMNFFWVESSRFSAASILFLLRYLSGGRPKTAENSRQIRYLLI